MLKYIERRILCQRGNIQYPCLGNGLTGIIHLVYSHSNTVWRIGHLSHCIADKSIVLASLVFCGYYIKSIADVEQRCGINIILAYIVSSAVGSCQFFCQSRNLFFCLLIHGGTDGHIILSKQNILGIFKSIFHNLDTLRCPGTIFDQRDGSVLIISLSQMVHECFHKRKYFRIVCGGGKNQLVITERILHSLSHITSCQVVALYLRCAGFF